MNTTAIIQSLTQNHQDFIQYLDTLSATEYEYSVSPKWSAGQQLAHIVLCVKPLVQVFSMDAGTVEKMFGRTDRPGRNYGMMLNDYREKLNEGGAAPGRYVPETATFDQRTELSQLLTNMISELNKKIGNFSEQELDTLHIPHPLLGNLTMREMLYNAVYHVTHHHQSAIANLNL